MNNTGVLNLCIIYLWMLFFGDTSSTYIYFYVVVVVVVLYTTTTGEQQQTNMTFLVGMDFPGLRGSSLIVVDFPLLQRLNRYISSRVSNYLDLWIIRVPDFIPPCPRF
jgi:hypothetical protein